MDVHRAARSAVDSERTTDIAELRNCIGSARFGVEAHEALVEDFPSQPSQKDGLGRMCKTHWNQYTAGLAREAKARKAAEGAGAGEVAPTESTVPAPATRKRSGSRRTEENAEVAQEPATE
jgi:hypothetical protein